MLAFGCSQTQEREQGAFGGGVDGVPEDGDGVPGDDGEDDPDGDDGDGGPLFDVGSGTGEGPPCEEGADCDECESPHHEPCDAGTSDPFAAMGLGCPGEWEVILTKDGSEDAIGVRAGFGDTDTWDPTEGSVSAVLGSGLLSELDSETPDTDGQPDYAPHSSPTYCNDDLGDFDPQSQLPPPLRTQDVGAQDCIENPALVGSGDCSNTIQGQFSQGLAAYDYTELRLQATVPPETESFSYDFAFFSTEYPFYYGSSFNDMYVAWLESEKWTGNVSFDDYGNPISLNAGFLDFRDDSGTLAEFSGTCMRYHAGTRWLSTTAGVTPGEDITVVFAIFDLADSILDSYVLLDNWLWGCDGDGPPNTVPVG
jgi:hypothetical protein